MLEPAVVSPGVVDAHCHAASRRFIPRSFVEGAIRNITVMHEALGVPVQPGRLVDRALEALGDHGCDELVRQMDEAGVDWSVLLLPDFTYRLKDCELTIEEMFVEHRRILERHPGRFQVLAGVDPRWGRDGLALFERGLKEYGFRGLKLYPPCGYRADDHLLYPFYELCAAWNVPVLLHMGPTSSNLDFEPARPGCVDEPARLFPKVNFILAHAATAHVDECAMLCAFRPNVYADVSGFQEGARSEGRGLSHLLRSAPAHKLLFGTDWPVFQEDARQAEHLESFLEVAREVLAGPRLRLVLRENASRLFRGR
ncbi:amidohydrolase [Cystobacter fuscus]|uniref:Amidohydrolase n=1 Tax=Cystobacter fuscus TaxID=43 RepID=A0A250J380_9BACT|nr:amidohydrolase family protein [Cystobacter fuscus]ATB37957.1 amidohydrolase [Cystobacter fuscus]